jgi:hypothetical protein
MEYLGDQSMAHFDRLRQGLDDAGSPEFRGNGRDQAFIYTARDY